MWLRQAFYRVMFPAAVVLPLWLLIGWGVFQAGGWAFLWVIFIAIPAVFIGQLVFALLVRARPSARQDQAASWWDVLGFGLWNGLTIACGFFNPTWFWAVLTGAIVVGIGLFWLLLWQLWDEARSGGVLLRTTGPESVSYIPPQDEARQRSTEHDVFIVTERPPAP